MIVAEFIECQRITYGVPHTIACRALQVSESWFYEWINRKPTARQLRRARLDEQIGRLFAASGGTYGSRGSPMTCGRPGGGSRSTPWRRAWPSSAWPAARPGDAGR
jgi:hypothetical protein